MDTLRPDFGQLFHDGSPGEPLTQEEQARLQEVRAKRLPFQPNVDLFRRDGWHMYRLYLSDYGETEVFSVWAELALREGALRENGDQVHVNHGYGGMVTFAYKLMHHNDAPCNTATANQLRAEVQGAVGKTNI